MLLKQNASLNYAEVIFVTINFSKIKSLKKILKLLKCAKNFFN